jgi:hypothetical protein
MRCERQVGDLTGARNHVVQQVIDGANSALLHWRFKTSDSTHSTANRSSRTIQTDIIAMFIS